MKQEFKDLKSKLIFDIESAHNCDSISCTTIMNMMGQLHCETGPAVITSSGDKEWWFEGERIPVSSQEDFEHYLKLKVFW